MGGVSFVVFVEVMGRGEEPGGEGGAGGQNLRPGYCRGCIGAELGSGGQASGEWG